MATIEGSLQSKVPRAELAQEIARDYTAYYDEFFTQVYSYIRYRCSDLGTADDLTAIVFEKALTQFNRFSPERGPFYAWLFGIARNEVNAYLRAQIRRESIFVEEKADHPSQTPTPEEAFIAGEGQRELLRALEALNSRERDLVGLKFSARLNNREIAALTGLSESNVGVILHRSIQKLRQLLKPATSER